MWFRPPPPPLGLPNDLPIPFRRRDADDKVYLSALLTGCLIGVCLSWQVILSDGARRQILGGLAASATSVGPVEASESRRTPLPAAPVGGMPDRPGRPIQHMLSTWPDSTTRSVAHAGAASAPLLERLLLAEDRIAAASEPAAEGASTVELAVLFDINSSFLAPAAISALRDLVAELPAGRSYRLALRAALSDDRVKGAKLKEAARYNRWLAERRLDRVTAWLHQNARAEIAVEPSFIERDSSRRVTISARPMP